MTSETTDGVFVRADSFVRRMDPGDTASVVFHARRFGRPVSGLPIYLSAPAPQRFPPGSNTPPSDPSPALRSAQEVVTDADGRATLQLAASDPGRPCRLMELILARDADGASKL